MSAQVRKIPERRCCGCGVSFPKRDLIRVVRQPDGSVCLDFTGKKSGRGAYVCKKLACFKKARKANRFASSLEIAIDEAIMNALEEEIRLAESQTDA